MGVIKKQAQERNKLRIPESLRYKQMERLTNNILANNRGIQNKVFAIYGRCTQEIHLIGLIDKVNSFNQTHRSTTVCYIPATMQGQVQIFQKISNPD